MGIKETDRDSSKMVSSNSSPREVSYQRDRSSPRADELATTPVVVVAPRYLNELKKLPDDVLSFDAAIAEVCAIPSRNGKNEFGHQQPEREPCEIPSEAFERWFDAACSDSKAC